MSKVLGGDAERVANNIEIDFSDWDFGDRRFFKPDIKALNETIREVMERDPPFMWFPWYVGRDLNAPALHPLDMFLELPLGEYEGENPTWKISLSGMIEDLVDLTVGENSDLLVIPVEQAKDTLRRYAAELRVLADTLEKAVDGN